MAAAHKKTFYLAGGKTFSSLKGMAKELARMPEEVYKHHVNKHKNDFAQWIKDSLRHDDLSERINGEINRIEMELEILRELLFPSDKKSSKKSPGAKKKSSSTHSSSKTKAKKATSHKK